MYTFDAKKATEACVSWIREWFTKNGADCNAVLGISGGKDSTVAAALCVEALGRERVFGVMMPMGVQSDIEYAIGICDHLGIDSTTINIKEAVDALYKGLECLPEISQQTRFNLPARVRMTTVYAVAQSKNGRVVNTCNFSEDWVGYSTRYGDSVGDFSPLSCFTVTEVKAIGRVLGVPERFIEKPPIDGLCGKTDEDNLDFSYAELDKYVREGIEPSPEKKLRIDELHAKNLFKLRLMDIFRYDA